MDLASWHKRYKQQAEWTERIREHLLRKARPNPGDRLLEVGVGTGIILNEFSSSPEWASFGIDLDQSALQYARSINNKFFLAQADGNQLPFPNDCFALSFCHYLLIWVKNPLSILTEMKRVTKPGGFIIALAEPDHASRIDYPPPLDLLGQQQTLALADQGIDTKMGRKLPALFSKLGFADIEVGILSAQWSGSYQNQDDMEWMTIKSDLGDRMTEKQLKNYRRIDDKAYQSGERVLFVPTFYAIGRNT